MQKATIDMLLDLTRSGRGQEKQINGIIDRCLLSYRSDRDGIKAQLLQAYDQAEPPDGDIARYIRDRLAA